MDFTIFYFSATGNSLEIARKIAKELGDCSIKPMTAQVPGEPVGGVCNIKIENQRPVCSIIVSDALPVFTGVHVKQ